MASKMQNFDSVRDQTTNRGFTLIEMITVIAIVGILASVAVPSFQSMRAQARWRSATQTLSGHIARTRSYALTRPDTDTDPNNTMAGFQSWTGAVLCFASQNNVDRYWIETRLSGAESNCMGTHPEALAGGGVTTLEQGLHITDCGNAPGSPNPLSFQANGTLTTNTDRQICVTSDELGQRKNRLTVTWGGSTTLEEFVQ